MAQKAFTDMDTSRQSIGSDELSDDFTTEKSSDSLLGHDGLPSENASRNRTKRRITTGAVYLGFWILNAIFFAFVGSKWSQYGPDFAYGPGTHYSPARSAIKYDKVQFQAMPDDMNVYRGGPRPEYEAAWTALLSATNVRITKEQLQKEYPDREQEPVALQDEEGGYVGMLDVMHQLHCLRMIRIAYSPELYPGWASLMEMKKGEVIPYHVDHCIDEIRQSLMCHADITVLVSDWIPTFAGPWPNFNVDHNCVNWDSIMQWSIDNHVDIKGKLKHPQFGQLDNELHGMGGNESQGHDHDH